MRTQIVLGALAALAVLGAPARAAEGVPDPAMQREFGAKLLVCNVCHGDNGVPKSGNVPIIWGQDEVYLLKQLQDFEKRDRDVEVMSWMAKTFSPAELAPAAAYVAKKNWPARTAAAAAAPVPRGMAVCQACHNTDFRGARQAEGMATPRLAGQSYEYLVQEMRRFAEGERKNTTTMVQIMAGIAPAEREAMARYLSGL